MKDAADFAKLEHLLQLCVDTAKFLAASKSNSDVPLLLHVAREIEHLREKLEQQRICKGRLRPLIRLAALKQANEKGSLER